MSSISPAFHEGLNVLFITADQWRGDALSCRGHPFVKTPNIDRLVADSVMFDRHYTNAVPCGPSRSSLHTGTYLHTHRSGTNGTPLCNSFTNWALEARLHGYDPVLFGYTDITLDPRPLENEHPMRYTYQGILPGLRPVMHMGDIPYEWRDWLATKGYTVPDDPLQLYKPVDERGLRLGFPAEHSDTAFMTDQCLEYMQKADSPFFVHLSLYRPHPPWVAPEPYDTMYQGRTALTPRVSAVSKREEASLHPWLEFALQASPAPNSAERLAALQEAYYGLVSEVDTQVGRVLDWLRESGQLHRTLIVLTSDHGEQLGDHFLLGKLGFFEASYHIPMIVRDPRAIADATRGTRVSAFTEHVDVVPTMLEFIGAVTPHQCQGRSLLPFLHGVTPARWRTEAHFEFDFRDVLEERYETALTLDSVECSLVVLRGPRYKYVHFACLPPLLFDLESDPNELVNVANDPAMQPVVLQCLQRLMSWRMTHSDERLSSCAASEKHGTVKRRAAASVP